MTDSHIPVAVAPAGAFPEACPPVPGGRDAPPRDPARSISTRSVSTRSVSTRSVPAISVSAMSVEDYARAVQTRTEFVDFLLAPARGELAAAA